MISWANYSVGEADIVVVALDAMNLFETERHIWHDASSTEAYACYVRIKCDNPDNHVFTTVLMESRQQGANPVAKTRKCRMIAITDGHNRMHKKLLGYHIIIIIIICVLRTIFIRHVYAH